MAKRKEMKQVILVRMDLKMPKGKLAAQCCHAAVQAAFKAPKDLLKEWDRQGSKKVVLKVKDKEELRKYLRLAKQAKLRPTLIRDAGRTFLKPGTETCLGIGPDEESNIDKVTGELSPL